MTGNFGSRSFDPIGDCDESLEVYICDDCLKSKASFGDHAKRKRDIHEISKQIRFDGACVVFFDE